MGDGGIVPIVHRNRKLLEEILSTYWKPLDSTKRVDISKPVAAEHLSGDALAIWEFIYLMPYHSKKGIVDIVAHDALRQIADPRTVSLVLKRERLIFDSESAATGEGRSASKALNLLWGIKTEEGLMAIVEIEKLQAIGQCRAQKRPMAESKKLAKVSFKRSFQAVVPSSGEWLDVLATLDKKKLTDDEREMLSFARGLDDVVDFR